MSLELRRCCYIVDIGIARRREFEISVEMMVYCVLRSERKFGRT